MIQMGGAHGEETRHEYAEEGTDRAGEQPGFRSEQA
jgi:hypothetical protein